MKVLIIHCAYQFSGGEDTVVTEEKNLLQSNGIEVEMLKFSNEGNSLLKMLLNPFNIFSYAGTLKKIKSFQPDLVHIHNLHFAASASVIYAIRKSNIPFVTTLHNYRLLCPSGILFHKGKPFLDSVHRVFPIKAVMRGVYKNSRLITGWLGFSMAIHQLAGTWKKCNRYIVLSKYAKDVFQYSKLKLREGQVSVKPNFAAVTRPLAYVRPGPFLYIGRLSEEKGINLLLSTFSSNGQPLNIAGEGPLKNRVIDFAKAFHNIRFIGSLTREEVVTQLQLCTALVFPSIWYEGMPMTIIEAFGCGTPVIASRLGVMQDMVEENYNGLLFEPGDQFSFSAAIAQWNNLEEKEKLNYREQSRATYEAHYTPRKNAKLLLEIYESVLEEHLQLKGAKELMVLSKIQ